MIVRHLLPMLALFGFIAGGPAAAWGPDGHRIVGDLAERRLSEAALAQVSLLVEDEPEASLAGVANWPDEVRNQPEWQHTRSWHYVNLPDLECRLDAARDCPDGQCIFGAITAQRAILADGSAAREDRTAALKFLVHLVGDVHQPLHAGLRRDRGGNDYQIHIDGQGSNLHQVWDSLILAHGNRTWSDHAEALADTRPETGTVDARDWAVESCRLIGEHGLYPTGHTLDERYLVQHRALAEQRLQLAAARLATLLESALAEAAARE